MTTTTPITMLAGSVALTVASAATPAYALLVMDPSSPSTPVSNTAPPPGTYGFGYWDNMLGAHTYLGNGYLLSTDHVGALPTSISIQGTSYNRVAQQRLTDPSNPGILTDLWVWKIDTSVSPQPTLPNILPILSGPVSGETTLIIGDGRTRAGGPTFWDITYNPGADDDVWTPGAPEGSADAKGFLASDTLRKEWGTNRVADADEDIEFSPTNITRGYTVNFAQTDGTEFEAQATNHDSAGPVFVKRNGAWQLTGLMHSIDVFEGQPTVPPPPNEPAYAGVYAYAHPDAPGSVFSNSTYISDLSEYTAQLAAFGVTVPEPAGMTTGAAMAIGLLARRRRRRPGT